MQILEFSISSVQSQQEPPHVTHPSLNLPRLFSSSTNIYTHQQSIPPPPVTLPPVLPLQKIEKIEGTEQILSQF